MKNLSKGEISKSMNDDVRNLSDCCKTCEDNDKSLMWCCECCGVPFDLLQDIEQERNHKNEKIEQIKMNILYDIYMASVNMAGEYQGCWVRFKDVEIIVNEHFRKVLEDD